MLWANLLHLSYNMWCDRDVGADGPEHISYKPYLRFDDGLWDEILGEMVRAGMNSVVIDLGDGVRYDSRPEIAVRDAWETSRLRKELAKARAMGLEPIPKLNFSTCHDAWLGPYSRCVSTEAYYTVCRDLIAEVVSLFDTPRLFHLGMDEETVEHQHRYEYLAVRQHDLWWHDLYFLVEQVERAGSRAWVWSDYVWQHPETFYAKMPKSVLQSNWYYGAEFDETAAPVRAYLELEARGYDQVPTGSNWSVADSFEKTVDYCRARIAPERLWGFLQTAWKPTLAQCRDRHLQAIDCAGRAIRGWKERP